MRCPKAWSNPDLPWMGAHDAVCPALRAEWGSSSNSLYSVSMVAFPSPNLPSCCPPPRTLTMYFFCNNAWPVLQASALAGTHMATVKVWQISIWLYLEWIRELWASSMTFQTVLITSTKSKPFTASLQLYLPMPFSFCSQSTSWSPEKLFLHNVSPLLWLPITLACLKSSTRSANSSLSHINSVRAGMCQATYKQTHKNTHTANNTNTVLSIYFKLVAI